MHTTIVKLERLGDVRVHHNDDWSGDVRIEWADRRDPHDPRFEERTIPGRLLIALSRAAALDWVNGGVEFALNDMTDMPL